MNRRTGKRRRGRCSKESEKITKKRMEKMKHGKYEKRER